MDKFRLSDGFPAEFKFFRQHWNIESLPETVPIGNYFPLRSFLLEKIISWKKDKADFGSG
jgi:hypothetical protein